MRKFNTDDHHQILGNMVLGQLPSTLEETGNLRHAVTESINYEAFVRCISRVCVINI